MQIITTSYDPTAGMRDYARQLAAEWHLSWVERAKHSISSLLHHYNVHEVIVVTKQGLKLVAADQPDVVFHPSLAVIRSKRWLNDERDTMLACSGAQPGDHVLDCTAGMASDAMMFALHVGETGRVVALESEFIPFLFAREGLRNYASEIEVLNDAMRRIALIHSEHTAYMEQLPSKSVDIVYFDPMFRRPVRHSQAIKPLRTHANALPLTEQAIAEARRIARRAVVMKEHRLSDEFARLGFASVTRTQSNVAYGVIPC